MRWTVQSMDHFTNNAYTHVARSKTQHYVRKSCTKLKIPPKSRKFYVDFTLIFWKTEKIATYLLSLNVCSLVRQILGLKQNQFQRFKCKTMCNPSKTPFFHTSLLSSIFKGKVPKVLWVKSASRPRKEPRYIHLSRP